MIRPIRQGSPVSVFEAVDAGTPVVVKQLNAAGGVADPLGVRRFEREIALCAMANHPGLAHVHGHGRGWIAFERLDRPDNERRWLPGLRRLVAQLAEALAYLHARGIVHRDVKPAHVMFRGEQPVLIDLGVAGLMADDPFDGEMVGSPAWMAPEQILGATPAPSADIWSLCAVAASVARGSSLFSGSAEEVLALRRGVTGRTFGLAEYLADDRQLLALLEAGLGPAEGRPSAAEMVAGLSAELPLIRLPAPSPRKRGEDRLP